MAKVAVAQMLSGEELSANLLQAQQLAEQAAIAGAKLLVLPENFAMLDSKKLIELAKLEENNQQIQQHLSQLAKKLELWIIGGTLPLLSPDKNRIYASSILYDEQGQQQARYDKIHLFDVDVADAHNNYRESDFIYAGKQLITADTPVGCIGFGVCYDMRFPEQFQQLRQMGAEIISLPSAFTYITGKAHWEILIRARAIETQCFVLAANQGGQHNQNRISWGHSMITNGWGEILAIQTKAGAGLITAELDLEQLHNQRQQMPIMQHRNKIGF